jgi:hypothetical protein
MARASKQRLSLVERQQKLLEDQGFSKPKATSSNGNETSAMGRSSPMISVSASFLERQEALLVKTGRLNATPSSRSAITAGMVDEGEMGDVQSVADSVASRFSRAPSIHPSVSGSMVSLGCSETTIGAGDDTGYWDFQHRVCGKEDLGRQCRECKQPFTTLGEPITERRGARISMRYHASCFSGFADPRSQSRSSHHEGRLAGSQMDAAPIGKAGTKMRTSKHFEEAGRVASSVGGKLGSQIAMGHNSFGAKSSKGKLAPEPQRGPGGFTAEQLADHEQRTHQRSLESIDEVGGTDVAQ